MPSACVLSAFHPIIKKNICTLASNFAFLNFALWICYRGYKNICTLTSNFAFLKFAHWICYHGSQETKDSKMKDF